MGAPESGLEIDSLFAHNRTKVPEHPGVPAHDQVCDDPYDGCEPREPIKTLKKREYEMVVASKYPGVKAPQ